MTKNLDRILLSIVNENLGKKRDRKHLLDEFADIMLGANLTQNEIIMEMSKREYKKIYLRGHEFTAKELKEPKFEERFKELNKKNRHRFYAVKAGEKHASSFAGHPRFKNKYILHKLPGDIYKLEKK